MKKKGFTQDSLSKKCKELGCSISQSTISGLIKGNTNIGIISFIYIAKALEVSMDKLFMKDNDADDLNLKQYVSGSTRFVTNPNESEFKLFLGTYNFYFYQTSGPEKKLVTGTIDFAKTDSDEIGDPMCGAHMCIKTGKLNKNGTEIEKHYDGQLVCSKNMQGFYCILSNKDIGEISMFIFRQWYPTSNLVEAILAACITFSSGSERCPTVHRLCLVRNTPSEEALDVICGQLLMNTGDIILEEQCFNDIIADENIPETFRKLMETDVAGNRCIRFSESHLLDRKLSEEEQVKWISYLRQKSITPKNNKIATSIEKPLYKYLV